MRRLIALLLLAAVPVACASTREGKVAQVQSAYTETAKTLVALRTAGKIDDALWPNIKLADNVAWSALTSYKNGVGTYEAVLDALAVLENYLVQGVK